MIKEWTFLRAIACLSILLLHSSSWYYIYRAPASDSANVIRTLLCFATPTFIVLSFIILFAQYRTQKGVPKNFWRKRLSYILLPFLLWAFIDTAVMVVAYSTEHLFWQTYYKSIFHGNFVGWFIIVLMQLFAVYTIVKKLSIPPIALLIGGLLLTCGHEWIWQQQPELMSAQFNHLSFTRWAVYLGIGAVIGHYYESLRPFIKKYWFLPLVWLLGASYFIYVNYDPLQVEVHSRRLDLLPVVISAVLLLLAVGQYVPNLAIIRLLSNYSLMIYFMHWAIMRVTVKPLIRFWEMPIPTMLTLSITAIIIAVSITKLLSFIPYSRFMIGRLGK